MLLPLRDGLAEIVYLSRPSSNRDLLDVVIALVSLSEGSED